MTKNPFQTPEIDSQVAPAFRPANPLGLRLLRISVAVILPIPMFVAMLLVVCDVFHVNKDAEYLRVSEAYQAGYLLLDILFYLLMASTLLGLPVVCFSLALEFLCKTAVARFITGVAFGLLIGLSLACLMTSFFTLLSGSHIAEALCHVIGAISVSTIVVAIVNMLHVVGGRKSLQPELANPVR